MSFVLTYTTLIERIKQDLERQDDVVDESIDSWIKFAQERIGRDSNTLLFDVYVTQSFQPNVPVINKPTRWQNTLTFNYGTGTNNNTRNNLLLRTYEWCRNYWPDDTQTGAPKYYADYGYNNWLIVPTPDQAYPFEICYAETPQVIDSNFQTNYLTQFMPEVFLKAVLLEAMVTLKNDERIPVVEAEYVKAISSWNSKDKFKKTDRYTTREAD
jgi:hypothetical protein